MADPAGKSAPAGVVVVVADDLFFFPKKCLPSVFWGLGIVFAECPTIDTRQNSLCR